jgi:5-formyltetrahydrofolate cyclo-ligase
MTETPHAPESSPLAEAKAEARRAAFARRKAARELHGPAPVAATEALLRALERDPAAVVSAYLPIRTEIDPRPALAALHERGRRLCLPVVEGPGRPLRFRAWAPGDPLSPGVFGAPVPAEGEWIAPEALIVPLAAFDSLGYRLGYGGGFYDRTLAALPGARALGFAYAHQLSPEPLPREATDVPLAAVATEEGIFRPASPAPAAPDAPRR